MLNRLIALTSALLVVTGCTIIRPPKPPTPPLLERPFLVGLRDSAEKDKPDAERKGLAGDVVITAGTYRKEQKGVNRDVRWDDVPNCPTIVTAVVTNVAGYDASTTEWGEAQSMCGRADDPNTPGEAAIVFLTKTAAPEPPHPPNPLPAPGTWTIPQLKDQQHDLMIWAPEIGCGPAELPITCGGAGIQAGWVWSLTIPRYSAAHRAQLYAKVKARGRTHMAVQVATCVPGPGYHDLYLITDCDDYMARTNAELRELHAVNLIPVCAGIAPNHPIDPRIDKSMCPIVMNDWDDSDQADCRVKAMSEALPNALIYFELPADVRTVRPDACSPSPFPQTGGQWLIQLQQKYSKFTGLLIEINYVNGFDANLAELKDINVWWRDVQQVLFETDTYWKFWHNYDDATAVAYNDRLMAAAPWLLGCGSGCSTHAAPVPPPSSNGHFDGLLDVNTVQTVNSPDFRSWPETTQITRVELRLTGVHVDFSKKDGPGRWPDIRTPGWTGDLQYSLGICMKIAATWYCNAPIEIWYTTDYDKDAWGGDDGGIQKPGQIPSNWFYDRNRWGAMAGYQPQPGEQVAIFVVAGDARSNYYSDPRSVLERSNFVLLRMPAAGSAAVFTP